MVELKEKTEEQLAKERALLSKIQLCNFTHWLQDLTVLDEMYGYWSKVWQQGKVDMHFSHSYHPDVESLDRFSWQFLFERRWWPNRIPNWAWGKRM